MSRRDHDEDRTGRRDRHCLNCGAVRARLRKDLNDGLLGTEILVCPNVGNCWASSNLENLVGWLLQDTLHVVKLNEQLVPPEEPNINQCQSF